MAHGCRGEAVGPPCYRPATMSEEIAAVAQGKKGELAELQAVLTGVGIVSEIICPPGSGHG